MTETSTTNRPRAAVNNVGSADAVYGLGLIGALVFFWQQADSFGEHVLGILKALVWPAFLVYEAFGALIS
jgi:hypothetical protein